MQPRGNRGVPATRRRISSRERELRAYVRLVERAGLDQREGQEDDPQPERGSPAQRTIIDEALSEFAKAIGIASSRTSQRGQIGVDRSLIEYEEVARRYTEMTGESITAASCRDAVIHALEKIRAAIAFDYMRSGK